LIQLAKAPSLSHTHDAGRWRTSGSAVHRTLTIFANGRACVTERVYRPRPGNIDISLIAAGGRPRLDSLEMWEMQPISPDRLTT